MASVERRTNMPKKYVPWVIIVAMIFSSFSCGSGAEEKPIPILWACPLGYGVETVEISDDGDFIVASLAVGGGDGLVLFGKANNIPLWSFFTMQVIKVCSISGNGEYIVASSGKIDNFPPEFGDAKLYLFEKTSGEPICTYHLSDSVLALSISGDGDYVVAATADNKVYLFNTSDDVPIWIANVRDTVYGGMVSITGDGRYIAAGSGKDVYLFGNNDNKPIWTRELEGRVREVAISKDGSTMVVGGHGAIYAFSVPKGDLSWKYDIAGEDFDAERISLSKDGSLIAVVAAGAHNLGKVILFTKASSIPLWSYQINDNVFNVDISDSGLVVAGSFNGKVYLFEDESNEPISTLEIGGHVGGHTSLNAVSISADGSRIAVGNYKGEMGKDSMLYLLGAPP